MKETSDIRWRQRLDNFEKAHARLLTAARVFGTLGTAGKDMRELACEGLIQRFEYTHELAWNVMKDYEAYQGYFDIRGSRDAIRKALAIGLVDDPVWMETIADRNLTSHSYDEEAAYEVLDTIVNKYIPLFSTFLERMKKIGAEQK